MSQKDIKLIDAKGKVVSSVKTKFVWWMLEIISPNAWPKEGTLVFFRKKHPNVLCRSRHTRPLQQLIVGLQDARPASERAQRRGQRDARGGTTSKCLGPAQPPAVGKKAYRRCFLLCVLSLSVLFVCLTVSYGLVSKGSGAGGTTRAAAQRSASGRKSVNTGTCGGPRDREPGNGRCGTALGES